MSTNDKTSIELEAEALEHEAEAKLLRAKALRRREIERQEQTAPAKVEPPQHMTRAEYAHRSHVSEATVSRWIAAGMPTLPVGTNHRIDPVDADEWRKTRPKAATTPKTKKSDSGGDIDIDDVVADAGLRRRRAAS